MTRATQEMRNADDEDSSNCGELPDGTEEKRGEICKHFNPKILKSFFSRF